MVNSRRRVYGKLLHFCPHCHSKKVVKNGHHSGGKLQFLCNTCHKHFTEEVAKGYPPTKIPFPVIAYLLYFRQKVPEFSNMRKFRKFVNHWLKYMKLSGQEVSRQTIHHWINNYEKFLDRVISFSEASDFCHSRIKQLDKVRPPLESIPYRRALKILERNFGRHTVIQLIKTDEEFFRELVEVVSKHGVFGWEFLEKEPSASSGSLRPISAG